MSYSLFLYLLAGVLVFLLLYLWATYNAFIGQRNQVKTDFADIDVQLKRRASLIENLATVVGQYAKHEKTTFEEVAKARSAVQTSVSPKQSAVAENMLSSTLRSLFALSERYPDLKASQNYQTLLVDIKETEDRVAQYREVYNQSVLEFNTLIQTFPNLMVAGLFNFSEEELFQPGEAGRQEVNLAKA